MNPLPRHIPPPVYVLLQPPHQDMAHREYSPIQENDSGYESDDDEMVQYPALAFSSWNVNTNVCDTSPSHRPLTPDSFVPLSMGIVHCMRQSMQRRHLETNPGSAVSYEEDVRLQPHECRFRTSAVLPPPNDPIQSDGGKFSSFSDSELETEVLPILHLGRKAPEAHNPRASSVSESTPDSSQRLSTPQLYEAKESTAGCGLDQECIELKEEKAAPRDVEKLMENERGRSVRDGGSEWSNDDMAPVVIEMAGSRASKEHRKR